MAVNVKHRKKLTNAQKSMNKKIKSDLQEQGILPADKKRLNRKKFALDILQTIDFENFSFYDNSPYIIKGLMCLLPYQHEGKIINPVTSEQVGVLKVLKIAIDTKAFWEEKKADGISNVTIGEFYDAVVKPIIDL